MNFVRCQICSHLKSYSKYKRHLRVHEKAGDLGNISIGEILFATRTTRKDISTREHTIRLGRKCSICSQRVLSLGIHLTRIHGLSRQDAEYSNIINASDKCERKEHYKDEGRVNYNPLFDFSLTEPSLTYVASRKIFNSHNQNDQKLSNQGEISSNIYDPPTCEDESDDEVLTDPDDTFNLLKFRSKFSSKLLDVSSEFEKFSTTTWGGNRSTKSVQMDVCNICKILNYTGEKGISKPRAINQFFTQESRTGKTPATIHSRIRSLFRFFEFIKTTNSNVLLIRNKISKLMLILKGMEKTILKDRFRRQKEVMAENRRKFSHTLETLKTWRRQRDQVNDLATFEIFASDPKAVLTDVQYRKMLEFLVVEIVMANAQRSGIIPGMLIE